MKKIIYIIVVLISLCFITQTYLDNNKSYDLKLESYNNHYIEDFAKKNKYNYKTLSDSEFFKLNQEYSLYIETFDYNNISTLEILGYNGKDKNIIIPKEINGKKVTSIKGLNENIKSIVISKNITNIDLESIKDIEIKCYRNEYCEGLFSNENLKVTILDDSDSIDFENNLNDFKYKINDNEIEITRYSGISDNLIIPEEIGEKKVTSIKELNKNVKSITISKNITNIDLENHKDIEIKCYRNEYCEELLSNEELKVTILNDSEHTNFKNNIIDFEYNIINNEIEITKLNGEYLIIPETVNGVKITTVSLNMPDMPTSIYIPTTVENINGITTKNINEELYISLIVQIITLCLILLVMSVLNKKNNENKIIYVISLYILSFIYLLIMNYIAYNINNNLISLSIIITIVYVIIVISVLSIKNRLCNYDRYVKNIDEFKNQALILAKKTENNEIIELIKYMDPISNDKTIDIEKEILEELKRINCETSENECKKLIEKIKDRNEICKNSK